MDGEEDLVRWSRVIFGVVLGFVTFAVDLCLRALLLLLLLG